MLVSLTIGPSGNGHRAASAESNVVTLRYATSLSEDSAYYKGAVALAQAADGVFRFLPLLLLVLGVVTYLPESYLWTVRLFGP